MTSSTDMEKNIKSWIELQKEIEHSKDIQDTRVLKRNFYSFRSHVVCLWVYLLSIFISTFSIMLGKTYLSYILDTNIELTFHNLNYIFLNNQSISYIPEHVKTLFSLYSMIGASIYISVFWLAFFLIFNKLVDRSFTDIKTPFNKEKFNIISFLESFEFLLFAPSILLSTLYFSISINLDVFILAIVVNIIMFCGHLFMAKRKKKELIEAFSTENNTKIDTMDKKILELEKSFYSNESNAILFISLKNKLSYLSPNSFERITKKIEDTYFISKDGLMLAALRQKEKQSEFLKIKNS